LTVLRALRTALPAEDFIYLGDTARLPYGTKSAASVVRYSLQCADALMDRGIRCLVVACNTVSSCALGALRSRYPGVPVIGVIEPGAAAAVAASRSRHVAVIGTEGTITGGAYQDAIRRIDAGVRVTANACTLFVAMAEAVARRYLDPIFEDADARPDTLVLGCTHFPVLSAPMRAVLPAAVTIIDSAATVAGVVARELDSPVLSGGGGAVTWLATDGAARFARVGGIFLGQALRADEIEIVDL
jgi:glutamate racemase